MNASTTSSTSKNVILATSILLFLIVFVQWQIYDLIMMNISLEPIVITILYVIMPAINLIIFSLFVKFTKSTFRKHGYRPPSPITTQKCLLITLILIAIYILFALAPGIMGTFGPIRFPLSPTSIIYRIANAALFGLATESIFRGYVFRNLLKGLSFFPSLYASALMFSISQISIKNLLTMSSERLIIYTFTNILTAFAAGLFLGFLFYKTGWSLLGPAIFRIGVLFYFEPNPISTASSPWWMALTAEIAVFALMILLVDAAIIEPRYRRKKYGLES